MADFRPNVIRANVLGKHVRVSRGSTDLTVVNRNLSLLLEARNLLPDDAEFNAWAQTHGIKDLTDSDYFKALVQLQRQVEADSQRASLLRSSSEVSEAIEPPKPRPVQAPQGAYRVDFDQHAARETAGGRFGAVNTFVAQGEIVRYPRQPANSPWASDPVPPEPPTGYDINAIPGQEPMKAAPTIDELLKEITRLREALEEARSGGAPVQTPSVEPTLDGESQPLGSPTFLPHT